MLKALPKEYDTSQALLPVIFVVFQSGSQANGGVESLTQIIEHLQQVKPYIVTQLETSINGRWRKAGAEVEVWPLPFQMGDSFWRSPADLKLQRLGALVSANSRMRQLVHATGCQVVHCNDISALWHTVFGARSAGAAVIHNVRDIKATDQSYGWRWQIALALSQRTVVLSQEMRASFLSRLSKPGSSTRSVDYIYSIVDFNQMQPIDPLDRPQLRAWLGLDPQEYTLGYVATFNPKKAQLAFIEQAGPLIKKIATSRIYFLGDFDPVGNDYARTCLEAAQRLGLEDTIRFVGYTQKMADWYRALDLVVLTSRYEGLARCMIEGLACGTPVVSFDVCSAREILEGYQCGRVVEQGNYPALAAQIAELAVNHVERCRLSQNGIRAARLLFNPQRISSQYEELYQRLANR